MKKFFLLSAVCLLSACGFHLKGLGGNTLNLDNLYVYSNLERHNESQQQAYDVLLDSLKDSGVHISQSEKDSQYKLIVSNFSFSSRQTAIGGDSGNTREVEITDGYTIALFKGEERLGESAISNRRNISYRAGQYIGSTQEESNTHEQLARENAQSALRFIRAKLDSAQ